MAAAALRRHATTMIVAMVTAAVTAGGPALARAAYDAVNTDKVDGKHAVGAAATRSARAGKLVATNRAGRLPNNIIAKAPNANLLDGKDSSAFSAASHLHDDRYVKSADHTKAAHNALDIDADTIDGLDSAAFANSGHNHDGRYFTQGEADGRYLGQAAKAADANLLDGLDSGDLREHCGPGWTYLNSLCWEDVDHDGFNYAAASDRCSDLGGRLPLMTEFVGVAKNGLFWLSHLQYDWAADVTADNEAAFVNGAAWPNDIDGVRAMSTSSYVRCVKEPRDAQGVG